MVGNKSSIAKHSNITIYTTSDFPNGAAPENFVRQMAIGLNAACEHVNVVLLRGHNLKKSNNDTSIVNSCLLFKKRFKNELLKFVELFLLILAIPFSVIRNRIQHKTNIILLFGVEYFYLVFPFYIIGRILGIKVFRIITDRYSDSGIAPTWWKHPKVFFYRIQYIFFDKYLSGIVCLSNYLKENAILNGVENKKICVIPHFIDIERFSNKAESNKPFLNEKIRLGFCGTLNESNGLFILLKAFSIIKKEYSKIELFLIGSISKDDQTIVNEMIDGISDSIIFVGNVQGNKVPELLSKCDILVNPRISSIIAEAGFPTKLGEYLATKRPVVATAVGDLKKYFMNERELILVVPDSPEALADGIFYLLHNKLKGLQIGLSGYEWALENLEFKKNCKKLLQFIMS